jgi:hypothetical protein
MEIWRVLQKIRNDGRLRNFENNFRDLRQRIETLNRAGPFVGRILTKQKFYAGKIEKLELKDDWLEFRIIDCDGNGQTNDSSKIYQKKISWEDLADIQVFKDKEGKALWLENLFKEQTSEVKND